MLTGDLSVETDDVVRFVFAVRNDGDGPADLTFRDSCHADFAVYNGEGERWRWSDGRMFMQVIEHRTVEPGGEETFEGEWESPESGEFLARAELCAQDESCEAETRFSV
ncbi:BsuPI-related putative proteinase inhibitor [Halomarina litorea]|uniref:BsuPI-related putative proteinase inhibitor n=1 Tax=Halomarina litorea TaxID=2961595 RepID=UPI0020C2A984|nr:BsuPI-related putative proteinase inhibitor [Halomarina sp. BCD28]